MNTQKNTQKISTFGLLLRSQKFLLMLLDLIISIALFVVGKSGSIELQADVNFLIAALQPTFLVLIYAVSIENVASGDVDAFEGSIGSVIVSLLHSRKFLTLLVNDAISLVSYFVAKSGTADLVESVKFAIGALQPIVVLVIYTFAKEDAGIQAAAVKQAAALTLIKAESEAMQDEAIPAKTIKTT